MAAPSPSLADRLAAVLPLGRAFEVYHLSTPPTRAEPLCSPLPAERPLRTFVESHFLALAIDSPPSENLPADVIASPPPKCKKILVFALEVFVYTTVHSSTLFVSKADSTGYLHLLGLPGGTPSPIRTATTVFLDFLVETRRRQGVQFVVSLFARAQDQYLFPGSIDNGGKHVLDDRGLVRWWCRVLDPMLERANTATSEGYIVIPGLDTYETKAFVPRDKDGVVATQRWTLDHPLHLISHHSYGQGVPARCLIPRFPDDPKSRFRDELDEELAHSTQRYRAGNWKSVHTLEQFWDMMAYRQECSSGRMTGFLWVVFGPDQIEVSRRTLEARASQERDDHQRHKKERTLAKEKRRKRKTVLTGAIKPRAARAKTQQRNYLLDRPTSTAYYHWPEEGRGTRILDEADYKRGIELLLHLDFANLGLAVKSTTRWVSEVGMGEAWGRGVVGKMEDAVERMVGSGGADAGGVVNNLSGLVKRKRADTANVLEVRKKVKEANERAEGGGGRGEVIGETRAGETRAGENRSSE